MFYQFRSDVSIVLLVTEGWICNVRSELTVIRQSDRKEPDRLEYADEQAKRERIRKTSQRKKERMEGKERERERERSSSEKTIDKTDSEGGKKADTIFGLAQSSTFHPDRVSGLQNQLVRSK